MKKPNLVFMYGEDSFSLSKELKRWKQAFVEKYDGDMNLEEIEGDARSSASKTGLVPGIASSISAMPFMADKRLVILKNFMQAQKADEQKKLIPVLEKLSDTTVLVITETHPPDKRTSLYKTLTKIATVRMFDPPKGAMLSNWITRRAQTHGGQMDSRAASYLSSQIGENLWQLENEVNKLCLFAQGQPITPAMVDLLTTGGIEQSIFTMTDQLARKDMAGTLQTMKKLQAQGQEAPYIFSMITRQFRLMLEIKALMEERMPGNAIARKMGVHPFVVQTTSKQCKNFTNSQLKRALRKLLEIDRRLKTGRIHLRTREEEQYLLAIERILLSH